jgi:hypothetical protein
MSTDILPPALLAPIPADQLLGLLFIGAMAKQGFSVERAAGMLPATTERMATRLEAHAAGVVAGRERATREAAEKSAERVAETGSAKADMAATYWKR